MSVDSLSTASTPALRPPPPRTPGLPLLGALPALLRRSFDFLRDARARHGDIYTLDLGVTEAIVLNHPRHIQHVLVDNAKNYYKGGGLWDGVRAMAGNGLIVSEGDFWLRQRRLMQPHFHRKRLAALTEGIVAATAESLDAWEAAASGRPFDVQPAFGKLTMRVICRVLFGQELGQRDIEAASAHASFIFDYLIVSLLTAELPRWLPIPGARRLRRSIAELDAIVYRIIAHERAAATPSNSLLGMLVELVDEETGTRMTDGQLRDEAMTFFLAGYETTGATLAWLVHTLTQHPQVLHAVEAELSMLLGGRVPVFEDLMAMPYTRAVIQETLRLYAPSLTIPRTAVADDEIDGYRIPAGATVLPFVYGVHHNPGVWEDPERFDPTRFLGDAPEALHRQAWIPFGAGQRQCIGRDLSLMETQIILPMLLQRFTLTAVPGRVARPKLASTFVPKGVHVYLGKRTA